MFLVLMDAYSKWLEVHITKSSTTSITLDLLRKSFSTLGLPEVIVSDNASNFTSEEFAIFMRKNGIRHIKSPSYHPSSNGLAERAVQTLKESLRKLKEDSLETRLSRFLFKYRITPHSSTGVSPAEIMFGRRLRTPLDAIRPNIGNTAQQKQENWPRGHARIRDFIVGDLVYVKNYASGPTWLPGRINEKCRNVTFEVVLDNGHCVRKHIDQLLSRHESGSTDMESLEGPVTPHDSQVAPETTSNTQVPMEDVTSPVPPLPIEQHASTTTEDSTPTVDSPDYTTGNTTNDDTIGVGTANTGREVLLLPIVHPMIIRLELRYADLRDLTAHQ